MKQALSRSRPSEKAKAKATRKRMRKTGLLVWRRQMTMGTGVGSQRRPGLVSARSCGPWSGRATRRGHRRRYASGRPRLCGRAALRLTVRSDDNPGAESTTIPSQLADADLGTLELLTPAVRAIGSGEKGRQQHPKARTQARSLAKFCVRSCWKLPSQPFAFSLLPFHVGERPITSTTARPRLGPSVACNFGNEPSEDEKGNRHQPDRVEFDASTRDTKRVLVTDFRGESRPAREERKQCPSRFAIHRAGQRYVGHDRVNGGSSLRTSRDPERWRRCDKRGTTRWCMCVQDQR